MTKLAMLAGAMLIAGAIVVGRGDPVPEPARDRDSTAAPSAAAAPPPPAPPRGAPRPPPPVVRLPGARPAAEPALGAPPPPPPPGTGGGPADPSQRDQRLVDTFTRRLAAEAPDPAWSAGRRRELESAIRGAAAQPRALEPIECRSATCRLVARFDSEDSYNAFFDALFIAPPGGGRTPFEFGQAVAPRLERRPDGTYEAELFVTRREPKQETRP